VDLRDTETTGYILLGVAVKDGGPRCNARDMLHPMSISAASLLQGSTALVLPGLGREGVRSLRQSDLRKAQTGLTSLQEVLAVTNE
jgi:hypothetical protein